MRITEQHYAGYIARKAGATAKPPLESDVLKEVMRALRLCRRVAWFARMNTGALESPDGQRWIRFGLPGMSDILGQTTDGRLLAIEVKRIKGNPTMQQRAFLARVSESGGIAFVAQSADDVFDRLRK